MVAPADVKKHTVASLSVAGLGKTPDKVQNGKDFYKYFFTHHPEHRKYFKGAENFTADDVQKSDRFEKLGTSILLSVHILANTYDNVSVMDKWNYRRQMTFDAVFRAFCRDTIDRHVNRGLDPALWKAFWPIWMAFLESKGATLSADQKAAWDALGTTFNEECQQQLAKHGLPHL
ncbi:hypothetical protein Y032_0044g998 [Ancylostoma ceylanicum]|uniref:Globin domain-containing protein n=1 Tax=Ancylostoma ceylanicum TaxID=53326 RepID=A0A016UE59_9BILA|nr:hypothetical protein Y032_0044g998 [Ancylostoma ceylanicum]